MKKLLVVLAMVPALAAAAPAAQGRSISAGTFSLTGDSTLGYTSSTQKQNDQTQFDTTTFNLGATGQYYVIPNLGIGALLNYNSTEDKTPAGNKNGLSTLLIGPVVGYDFPIADQLGLFAQAFLGYSSATFTQTGSADQKGSGYGYGIQGGLKYFLVSQFSFDAALRYSYTKNTFDALVPGGTKPEVVVSGFGLNVGLSVYFGGGK